MIELSRYEFESLRTGKEFNLYRGRGVGEFLPILVRAPSSERPEPATLKRLEHEYSLRNDLDPEWAARPLGLSQLEGRTVLILEDPGGELLDRFVGEPMELSRFLLLAINLAAGLGKFHRRGLIHKDIKPGKILANFRTHQARFTGFEIASRLPRERQALEPPELIAGTLPYMAPEQTGRMNRSIDSRTDLYSLGVMFYQLLFGSLPFTASTPTSQLSAISSTLRLYDFEKKELILEFVVHEGRVIAPAEAGYPKDLRSISLADPRLTSWVESMTVNKLGDPQAPIPDVLRSHLLAHGVRTLLIIPLILAERPIGCMMFRFAQERSFNAEELEIARALATQASLAIRLTQLAKAARKYAVLEERNRLAAEIHDSLAQSFAGISMQLSVAARAMKSKSKDAYGHVERAIELARFGLSEARRSALSLRSNVIEESGLIEALSRLVERSNIPGLLRCSFRCSRVREESLAPPVQQDLLRIAQEAMSNAIRHARPTEISVGLRWNPPNLLLKISDNGSGFVKARQIGRGEGFGFANMQARAKNLGAELDIQSKVGGGTSVIVRLPIIS